MFSPVVLQNSCHTDSPNSFAATEVEPFFPSDCPAASPQQCLAEPETSAFQNENTNELPLQIQLYPERPRTPAISRPMDNKDALLYSHIAADEINRVPNSLLNDTPVVTRTSKVTDFFHTRAVCYTNQLISLSVKVKSQKTQSQSWKYMTSPSKVQEPPPHYERHPEVHHQNTIWSHLVHECSAEGDEAHRQHLAVESPKAKCSHAQFSKSSNADKKDPFILAQANCTPFFSPKHLDFVTEKNSFFCHLENTVFQTLPKNAFFISFAHFWLFLGGSNNHSLVQITGFSGHFARKKLLLANLKNTNFWIVWKTIKHGRCSHILYMSTRRNTYYGRLSARGLTHSASWSEIFRLF